MDILSKEGQSLLENQVLMRQRRGGAFAVKTASGPFLNTRCTLAHLRECVKEDPVGFLAYFNNGLTGPCLDDLNTASDTAWNSEFLHRMLLLTGILSFARPSVKISDADFVQHALNQVVKLTRGRVHDLNPRSARFVLDRYLPSYMTMLGIYSALAT